MNTPSLAVIVPVWNEEKVVKAYAKALQSLPCDELYIVDGGSSDATQDILRELGVNLIQSPSGRAKQMNVGASQCKSDILLFIHIDTSMSSSHIQALKEAINHHDIVGGHFDVQLSGKHWMFRVIETMMNIRSCLTGISTGDQCQFVRRSVFEEMGGFPEQALMEDVEFSKRLKGYGKLICLKNKVVTSSRRWEKYGILKTVALMWKLRLLYACGVTPEKLSQMYKHAR